MKKVKQRFQEFVSKDIASVMAQRGFEFLHPLSFRRPKGDHEDRVSFASNVHEGQLQWGWGIDVRFPQIAWLLNNGTVDPGHPVTLGCHVTLLRDPPVNRIWIFPQGDDVSLCVAEFEEEYERRAEDFFERYGSLSEVQTALTTNRHPFAIGKVTRVRIMAAIDYLQGNATRGIELLSSTLRSEKRLKGFEEAEIQNLCSLLEAKPNVPATT